MCWFDVTALFPVLRNLCERDTLPLSATRMVGSLWYVVSGFELIDDVSADLQNVVVARAALGRCDLTME